MRERANGREAWTGRVAWIALAAACGLAVCFALHRADDIDLGYHLAYGEHFLTRGGLVDSGVGLYPSVEPGALARPGERPPGDWYDAGREQLRFPNANYLSQILMTLTYRVGGSAGIVLMQGLLVLAIAGLLVLIMQRFAVPRLAIAAGLLLATFATYERFGLRPELFGYVVLLTQLYLLCGAHLTRRTAIAIVALQVLFVQLHSYWLLGLGLVLAFLSEAAWRVLVERDAAPAARERLRLLGITAAGMLAVAFINPWGARLAQQPIATLFYLRTYATGTGGSAHPWTQVSECQSPFAHPFVHSRTTVAFIAALAIAALAAAVALLRRRWAPLALLLGMGLVGLSMRRNIAAGSLVLVPVSLGMLVEAIPDLRARFTKPGGRAARSRRAGAAGPAASPQRRAPDLTRWAPLVAGGLLALIAIQGMADVASSRFYYRENRKRRFGIGPTQRDLPLAASRILRNLPQTPRVFTSYNTGSTVLFFGRSGDDLRGVPIYSNQWAYPASVMAENFRLTSAEGDFAAFARRNDVGWAVLDCTREHSKLARQLLQRDGWRAVHFDGLNILLERPDLAPPAGLPDFPALDALIADIRATEPCPAFSLQRAAVALQLLELPDPAARLCREALAADPRAASAWQLLGGILATRASRELQQDMAAGAAWQEMREAQRCFREALRLRPKDAEARDNLRRVDQLLTRAPR
jgi:hypothetical protein